MRPAIQGATYAKFINAWLPCCAWPVVVIVVIAIRCYCRNSSQRQPRIFDRPMWIYRFMHKNIYVWAYRYTLCIYFVNI